MQLAIKGAVYVNLRFANKGDAVAILRDTCADGYFNEFDKFGPESGDSYGRFGSCATAMRIHDGYVYFSSELVVYRVK